MAKRVLGQLLRKPKVVRMSGEDAGPKEWRPDFSQSPIVHEHHGWVHGPEGAVKEESPGRHFPADIFGTRQHERHALERLIHNDSPKAVSEIPTIQVSDGEESPDVRPPQLTHFYVDYQGNTTAHRSPQHDRMYDRAHDLTNHEGSPEDYWDWLKMHHDDAVAKGQVYHRVAVHPEWEGFIRTADKDPELAKAMAHDWALENGYDDLAEAMNANRTMRQDDAMKKLGGMPQKWLKSYVKVAKNYRLSLAEPVRVLGKVIQMAQPPSVDMRHRYHPIHRPTDLTDSEWLRVKHHFPVYKEAGGRVTPIRVYLNATMFRLETGTPLRALPPDFPRWGSVHSVEDHIAHKGLWPIILEETGRTHLLPALQKMIHGAVELPPGGLPPKLPVASPVAMSHGDHSYGCLHINLPPAVAAEVLAFASQIPDEELGKEGREACPHVTVRYGLKPRVGVEDVQSNLLGAGPAHYSLGKLGLFPGKDCDVLYVSVDSPDLAALNMRTSALDHDELYGAYVPHVTVAHLKKGLGTKYLSQDPFCGICCCATQVVFSPKSGDDFFVNLTDQAPPSADKLPGGKADDVPPGTYGAEEEKGMMDEMEHTSDPGIAAEVARDHLTKHGIDYYDRLQAVGLSQNAGASGPIRTESPGVVVDADAGGVYDKHGERDNFGRHYAAPAMAEGQPVTNSGFSHKDNGSFHYYADPEGNVTAHFARHGGPMDRTQWDDLDKFRNQLAKMHGRAVANGNLYFKAHPNEDFLRFARHQHKNPDDPHAHYLAHDWALENGHDDLAEALSDAVSTRDEFVRPQPSGSNMAFLGMMTPEDHQYARRMKEEEASRRQKQYDDFHARGGRFSLGERRVLGKVIRMAMPVSGGGQTGSEPLVRHETPGQVVDHDDSSAVFTNYTTRPPFDVMQLNAVDYAKKAVTSGEPQYRVFETDPEDPRPTHAFHLYADPEGNVTAHRSRQFWEGSRNRPDSEATMEGVKKAHEEALGRGSVYHKMTAQPQFQAFLSAIHQNPGDTSNHAMLTDWLLENGHDDLADVVRHYQHARRPDYIAHLAALEPHELKGVADKMRRLFKAQFSLTRVLGKAVRLSVPFTPLDTQYVMDHDRGRPARAGFYFPANEADRAYAQAKESGVPVATAAPYLDGVVHVFADPIGNVTAHVSRRAQALRKGGTGPESAYHQFLSELHGEAADAGRFYRRPGGEIDG